MVHVDQRMAELTWGAVETAQTALVNGTFPKLHGRTQSPEMAVLIRSTEDEVWMKEVTLDTSGMLVHAMKSM